MISLLFSKHILLIGLTALTLISANLMPIGVVQAADAGYKVGDRLGKGSEEKPKPKSKLPPSIGYQEIDWDGLMPKNWDPMQSIKNLRLDKLKDGDPRAAEAMEKVREAWDHAPVEPKLNGKMIRIAGFVVPLEQVGTKVSEFLLVPYFGACIHVPPPPANQVIYVTTDKPVTLMSTMDAVWVNGELHTDQLQTQMGQSGYRMKANLIERYKRPR